MIECNKCGKEEEKEGPGRSIERYFALSSGKKTMFFFFARGTGGINGVVVCV